MGQALDPVWADQRGHRPRTRVDEARRSAQAVDQVQAMTTCPSASEKYESARPSSPARDSEH